MAITINTNVTSMRAQINLAKASDGLSDSMSRLSSGLRVRSAADDAALRLLDSPPELGSSW